MEGTFPVGYAVMQTKDQSRAGPILIDAWFPAAAEALEAPIEYSPGSGNAALNAEAAAGRFPTIVMSHGAMGSARNSGGATVIALGGGVFDGLSMHNTEDGLSAFQVPIHIVGAVQNDFLPFDHNAGTYARLIPGAALTRLNHGEGHFVFLNKCDADISVNGVPLCRDKAGVHRESVHEYVGRTIKGFLDMHLSAA